MKVLSLLLGLLISACAPAPIADTAFNAEPKKFTVHEFNNEVQHSGMGDCRTRRCGACPEGTIICQGKSGIT